MKSLIKYSVEHPVSIIMYFSLAIILGAISVFALNVSFLPETKERHILISTEYQGVAASEVRTLITVPLEEAISSLKGIKNCESVTREGLSLVKAELKWGTNIDLAMVEAKSIVDAAMETLPQDCPMPKVQKLNLSQNEKIKICVIPKNADICLATNFCNEELKTKLLELEGIAEIKILGGQKEEIQVTVDSKKAAFYKVSLENIAQSLNASNYEYPAGTIQVGENQILLKTQGLYKNFDDILNTSVKHETNGSLKLRDFASVEKVPAEFSSFVFYNSKRGVQIEIACKNSYSPIRLSSKIRSRIFEMNEIYGDKFDIAIIEDASKNILSSIKSLLLSALAGITITIALLYFFVRSAKIAAIIASVIPFSILFSLFILFATKRSINLISLSGITICLGMIIDNSIISVLSIAREIKKSPNKSDSEFKSATIAGLEKITLSNSASTLTTIVVFLPLFFLDGILGEVFCDLSITVIGGMAFSLLFSFTVIPAAAVLFLRQEFFKMKSDARKSLEKKYRSILEKTLDIKILPAAIIAISVFASAIFLLPIKKEIQPKSAQNDFQVQINFPSEFSIEKILSQGKILAEEIQNLKTVENVLCAGGIQNDDFSELLNPRAFPERLIFKIESIEIKKCKKQVQDLLEKFQSEFDFVESEDLISSHLAIKSDLLFLGDDEKKLRESAEEIFENFSPNYFTDGILFSFDTERLSKHGMSTGTISIAAKNALEGIECLPYYENGKEVPLKIRFPKNEFSSERNLGAMPIFSENGILPLSTFGKFIDIKNEAILYRYDKKDAKIIAAEEHAKIKTLAPFFQKSRFVSLKQKSLEEIFSSGATLLALVLALLYCLLGAQSESFSLPLIFLLALPPAFFGAIFFLALFLRSLNINSILALVVLFGTSVNNSILLCEGIKGKTFCEKSAARKSIINGAAEKLNMILVTSATSIAALIPFAFVFPSKNPQSGMSLAIIGGLLFSATAVIIFIPNILYQKSS
ncbi:MAG: efflux RND transporter permease subunit [Treponemataceae bacterium]|nr:efflux RND transporter permease subunit [Treponemataceae bacterium]